MQSGGDNRVMHPSMKRLLDFARQFADSESFVDLGVLLDASSATMTNWKARGLSKYGALAAERTLGCSAHWLLTGEGPMSAHVAGGTDCDDPLAQATELLQAIRELPARQRQAGIAAARAAVADVASAAETGGPDGSARMAIWCNVSSLMIEHWGKENLTRLRVEAGIGASAVSGLKDGARNVGVDTLEKIAAVFGVRAFELLMPPRRPRSPAQNGSAAPA